MRHGTRIEEPTQLTLEDALAAAGDEPEPEPAAGINSGIKTHRSPRRRRRHGGDVKPDRFARRLDGRISVLCKPLPPSAEPVLKAVVSAMAGGASCTHTYDALAAVSSVSVASFKRMIPLLRREGLLNAFDRDGNYVPPPEPGQPRGAQGTKAMLTLRLGPMFELSQPELETPPERTLDFPSGRTSGRSTPPDRKPSGLRQRPRLVSDSDQSGLRQRPLLPPQKIDNEEAAALAVAASSETPPDGADDPTGSPPSRDEVRAAIAQAKEVAAKRLAVCARCDQVIEPGQPHTFGGTTCPA